MTYLRSCRMSACLIAALLVIPWASFAQPTNVVDSLQTRYEAMRQKIDAEALAAYSNVLVTVGKQLQQKADVDGYLLLKSEQRFIAEKQVLPEGSDRTNLVGKLPALDAPLSRIEANRNTKMANLLKQYIPALEAQIRQFMTADKLDEVKAAGEVKSSAELALADFQAKLPKAESPTGKPSPLTEKKPETKSSPSPNSLAKSGNTSGGSGIPQEIRAAIAGRAETDFPNNKMEQKNHVQWQSDAYAQIQALKKKHSVPDDVFATLLDRAQTEYPNDYMQQRNILQWNSDAYAQIQALKKKHSVPDDVFAALLDKGGADYPNN